MQKIEFEIKTEKKLIKAIIDELPFLSRFDVEKILENKDVKVNNIRIKQDVDLSIGDKVVVFYTEKEQKEWYTLVYSDDNVVIVNKRAGIEVVSEKERDLVAVLKQKYDTIIPVHRIDRNTEGLVIFALNKTSEKSLLSAFKIRNGIIKKYALLVHGRVDITKIKRTVYLKKVEGIKKMVEDGRGNTEVLTQLRAVRAAVKGMEIALLTDLLRDKASRMTGVSAQKRGEQIEEMVTLMRRYGE